MTAGSAVPFIMSVVQRELTRTTRARNINQNSRIINLRVKMAYQFVGLGEILWDMFP